MSKEGSRTRNNPYDLKIIGELCVQTLESVYQHEEGGGEEDATRENACQYEGHSTGSSNRNAHTKSHGDATSGDTCDAGASANDFMPPVPVDGEHVVRMDYTHATTPKNTRPQGVALSPDLPQVANGKHNSVSTANRILSFTQG